MSVRNEFIRLWNEYIGNGKKISELPAGSAPTGTELIEAVQGGQSVSLTVNQVSSGGVGVTSVVAGTNVTVDNTDPQNPIVSASGGGGGGTWGSITGTLSDQTDLQAALDLKELLYRAFRRETGNTGLVLSDAIGGVEMNVGSANTVTVPLNATQAFPVGTLIPVVQYGAGLTSIVATGGVTINTSAGNLNSPGQYAPMFLRKIATNEWYLWNGTAGGATPTLQEVLDEGSTATVTTDVSISRTSEFSFAMTAAAGIVMGTTTDPIQIGAGGVGAGTEILMLVDTLTRLQLGNHNDYYTNGGTAFHRFFCPGAGAQIRLMEESGSGSNYIGLRAPTDVTTAQIYTFPAAGPATNGDILASTTAGQLSWISPASSVPDSSETVKGIIEIATQGEVTTGTDDVRAITPLKLAAATRGTQDLFISATAMWPRTTGACADLTKTELATSLFNIQSLDFDQTTQEFCQFQIVLPRKWNNGTVTAVFYWTASAGTGTVQFGISGGAYSNDDALTVAFGSAQTADDTLLATNDLHISPATSAITLAGTPADADFLAFQISRNPASDTLNADAKLLGVSIRLTTDSALDA